MSERFEHLCATRNNNGFPGETSVSKTPSHFVNKLNRKAYEMLFWLQSTKGKKALSESHLRIVEYIGSFPPTAGCFASNRTINSQTCRSSMKAFLWNLGYLIHIGAIRRVESENGRTLYLSTPNSIPVMPQSVYRHEKGITSYSYLDSPEKPSFFDETKGKVFHPEGKIIPQPRENFSSEGENFSHIQESRTDLKTEPETTPPKAPPPEPVGLAALDREAALPRPQAKGFALREGEKDFFEETGKGMSAMAKPRKEYPCDPLEPGDAKHKNTQERMAEAVALHNRGHIVNPLGKVDNRGRRIYPERARLIGETGEPTDTQLYRYLHDKFEENGWHGVFVQEMQPYRDCVSARLADLRQKFMETCGCQAKNRTLYEYFRWFLDPSRLDMFMASAKRAGRDYPAWQQMCGTVYLRRFYESEAKNPKAIPAMAGKKIEKIQEDIEYLQYAYDRIRKAEDSEIETARCLREFGMVMYAVYLHDQRLLDGSEAKQSIVKFLTHFLQGFTDRVKGERYVKGIAEVTMENEECGNGNDLWPQWKETSGDIVKLALEQAGYNRPMEVPGDADEEKRHP